MRFILTNTNALSVYLQGKDIDVYNARTKSFLTIEVLKSCRNEDKFVLLWQRAEKIKDTMKNCIADTDFSVKEARVPRTKGSQDVPMTPMSYYRINTYYPA